MGFVTESHLIFTFWVTNYSFKTVKKKSILTKSDGVLLIQYTMYLIVPLQMGKQKRSWTVTNLHTGGKRRGNKH